MQFGLTITFYSRRDDAYLMCTINALTEKRLFRRWFPYLWQITMSSNLWEEERIFKAEGSNSGSLIYGYGTQVSNLHSQFLHNRT